MQIQNVSIWPDILAHVREGEMNLLCVSTMTPTELVSSVGHILPLTFRFTPNKQVADWWPVPVTVGTDSSTLKKMYEIREETTKINYFITGSAPRDEFSGFYCFFLVGEIWTSVVNGLLLHSCSLAAVYKPSFEYHIHNKSRSNYPPLSGGS